MKKNLKITLGLGALALAGLSILSTAQAINTQDQASDTLIGNIDEGASIKLKSLSTENGIRVTASITSEYADINWSVAWASANNKNVSDYVTITPSADTLSCEVNYIKQFDTQIVLTATMDEKTATCTVDCYERFTGNELIFIDTFEENELGIGQEQSGTIDCSFVDGNFFKNETITLSEMLHEVSGTIDTTITNEVKWYFHEDVIQGLDGISGITVNNSEIDWDGNLYDIFAENLVLSGHNVDDVMKVLTENSVTNWFVCDATWINMYGDLEIETYTQSITFGGFDLSDYYVTSSLTFDKTGIIF